MACKWEEMKACSQFPKVRGTGYILKDACILPEEMQRWDAGWRIFKNSLLREKIRIGRLIGGCIAIYSFVEYSG